MPLAVLSFLNEKDRYSRTLATVMVDGANANLKMVRQGLAWHLTRYSKDMALAEAEREARAAKRGLWGDPIRWSRGSIKRQGPSRSRGLQQGR